MNFLDSIIIYLYLLAVLIVGISAGRGVKSLERFSVAGRNYPSFIVFATLSASFIGGGFTMGNAEKVFTVGIVNIFALWGFSLKELLVARYIAPRMDRFSNAISVGDIMQQAYGKIGKVVAGVFGMTLCAGILGAQVGAMGYMFNVFMGIDFFWGVIIGFGIVISYSTVGGMAAVVLTDVMQFVVLGIGIPATLAVGVYALGGWDAVAAAVPPDHFRLLGDMSVPAFISLFLTFLLGETLVPPYVQRLLIGRDTKSVRRGTMWSGLFSIPFFAVTGLIGLVAYAYLPSLDSNLALPYVIQQALPVGLKGLVVAAVISVVMSSADSFLNAAAVAFSHDVLAPLRKNPLSARAQLWMVRAANALVGILAVIFAVAIESVLDILIYAYHFWSPIILPPLAAAHVRPEGRAVGIFRGRAFGIPGDLDMENRVGDALRRGRPHCGNYMQRGGFHRDVQTAAARPLNKSPAGRRFPASLSY